MAIKLASKAYGTFRLIQDTSYKQRTARLESMGELGFVLLLYWNQIEGALKLIRYGYDLASWPDKLDFISANWGPLKRLKADNPNNYELVFGKSGASLKSRRNEIVHQGENLTEAEYQKFKVTAKWAVLSLLKEIPTVEQLREKKRRVSVAIGKPS